MRAPCLSTYYQFSPTTKVATFAAHEDYKCVFMVTVQTLDDP